MSISFFLSNYLSIIILVVVFLQNTRSQKAVYYAIPLSASMDSAGFGGLPGPPTSAMPEVLTTLRSGAYGAGKEASSPPARKPKTIKLRKKFPETWIWTNVTAG